MKCWTLFPLPFCFSCKCKCIKVRDGRVEVSVSSTQGRKVLSFLSCSPFLDFLHLLFGRPELFCTSRTYSWLREKEGYRFDNILLVVGFLFLVIENEKQRRGGCVWFEYSFTSARKFGSSFASVDFLDGRRVCLFVRGYISLMRKHYSGLWKESMYSFWRRAFGMRASRPVILLFEAESLSIKGRGLGIIRELVTGVTSKELLVKCVSWNCTLQLQQGKK